jgi:F-type H+-transporting ATPase subunit delta
MSSLTTLARPYAKAAFQLAREQNALQVWDERLHLAGSIAGNEAVSRLIENPEVSAGQALSLIADAGGENFDERFRGYLSVLAENGRLPLLGEIAAIYGRLRQEAEKRLVARVVSAVELDADQRSRMQRALSKRFDADVELANEIDPAVIGGAVIYAGDEVIDGSLRGRLRKLEQSLAS